jgi:hypothetical protein
MEFWPLVCWATVQRPNVTGQEVVGMAPSDGRGSLDSIDEQDPSFIGYFSNEDAGRKWFAENADEMARRWCLVNDGDDQ